MTNKECNECGLEEAIFKCVSCGEYLCEDCANDNHLCFVNEIDQTKDRLFTDIELLEDVDDD